MTPDERIAELEARLAMVTEALSEAAQVITLAEDCIQAVHQEMSDKFNYAPARCARWCMEYPEPLRTSIDNARSATAPNLAAFLQRVESRGAAKELLAITNRHKREIVDRNELVHDVVASAVLYARAGELERP